MCIRVTLLAAVALAFVPSAEALLFESDCATLDQWDVLDLSKDIGQIHIMNDLSCPPGHGPEVIRVKGDKVLLMPKGLELNEGTVVALYRENQRQAADADGVVMVWSDYPMNIAHAHNTKEERERLWLEQDNDRGFQFRYMRTDGKDTTIAERAGYGLVTDGWNRTGWIWQKVRIEGNRAWAKYWPAQCPEPEGWMLETEYGGTQGKRFGVTINSGDINLAYLAADVEDIPIATPGAYIQFPMEQAVQTNRLAFTLFTNAGQPVKETFAAVLKSGDEILGRGEFELDVPAGQGEAEFVFSSGQGTEAAGAFVLKMDKEPGAGICTVELTSANGLFEARRSLRVVPATVLKERIAAIGESAERLAKAVGDAQTKNAKTAALRVIADAARAHVARASELLDAADTDGADLSLRFAVEALAELDGYKGEWLREAAPGLELPNPGHDPEDGRRITAPEEGGRRDYYSKEYLLSFGKATLDSQSFCMGHGYEVAIPWQVEGAGPDRDFRFSVTLVSPLGNRVVARSQASPEVPTSQWQPGGEYVHKVHLDVLPEDPTSDGEHISTPVVEDEYHRLLVTVHDPESGAPVLLGNEPGPHPSRPGMDFLVQDVYVASAPIEIRGFEPAGSPVLAPRKDVVTLCNVGRETLEPRVVFTVTTETGRVVYQQSARGAVDAGARRDIPLAWTPDTAGGLTARVRVLRDGVVVTEARREIVVAPTEGYALTIEKANRVEREGDTFITPITVRAGRGPVSARVSAAGRLVGQGESEEPSVTINAEPWFGYYDVLVDLGAFRYDRRVVATVVETRDGALLVNGEPFIVKGVNVHGMDPSSPERTATMMRVMRELGFNMWRGDYPARWQVDLAYELNTAYTVLAPFSCVSTDRIFGLQAGAPMITSRELTRLFVDRYKDSAGVMLWNSCNEVGGETADFLLSMYAVYKGRDPYNRPVHYANLYGQHFHEGQDAIGTNNYFARGQTAESVQPVIMRMLDIAREHSQPLLFTEFNSYYGAVQTTGAEAFRDMFAWGVENGMSGGFQYMKGDSDRHPGVFDGGYNTHKVHNDAIIDALADAKVGVVNATSSVVTLEITNKRMCALRQVRLTVSLNGAALNSVEIADIRPKQVVEVEIARPQGVPGPVVEVTGVLEFTTHFGFKCKVPVNLFAR